jgi:hypothetical protein
MPIPCLNIAIAPLSQIARLLEFDWDKGAIAIFKQGIGIFIEN